MEVFLHIAPYQTLIPLFTELQGKRVIVRPYRENDAQALYEAIAESREHLRPWLPFAEAHQTIEESRDWIIRGLSAWLLRENLFLGIWEKETQRFLGGTGLHPRDWEISYFAIGYWVRASAIGRGM
jgi:ribosomal-protein-serine acetyltransferase